MLWHEKFPRNDKQPTAINTVSRVFEFDRYDAKSRIAAIGARIDLFSPVPYRTLYIDLFAQSDGIEHVTTAENQIRSRH